MLNYGYLTYQAERVKTQTEQRETDAQLGRISAAFAQLLRPFTKSARTLRRQPGTDQPGPYCPRLGCPQDMAARRTSPAPAGWLALGTDAGTTGAVPGTRRLPQPSQEPGHREADDSRPFRAYRSVT